MGETLTTLPQRRVSPHPDVALCIYDISCFLNGSEFLPDVDHILSEDEQRRACRYRKFDDKVRYIMGKFLARGELAQRMGCLPSEINFVFGDRGKPELSDPSVGMSFNVSHSGTLIAVAISSMPVGVDIELNSDVHYS